MRRFIHDLLLTVIAALPFLMLYGVHYAMLGDQATGWLHADMAYYCANGRDVFERGQHLLYPNPYDPDPGAPPIYFHWLIVVYGLGIVRMGIEPGIWSMTIGIVAGLACSYLTLRLVRCVVGTSRVTALLFMLTMWGGGVLVLTRLVANALHGRP